MDAILKFVTNNPITVLVLIGALYAMAVLTMGRRNRDYRGETDPEDIVPSYKRYDRREIERGDRRKARKGPAGGEERRQGPRRSKD